LTHDQRIRVLRALAGQIEQSRPASAAGLLRRARRLRGAESSLAFEEARAWIASRTPARAASPLLAFLRTHGDRAYAWAAVCQLTLVESQMPSLLRRIGAMAGTAGGRFAAGAAADLASGISETARVDLVRAGMLLLRSTRGAPDRPLLEIALADLVAGKPEEALLVHNAGLVTTLAHYRVASTLEAGSPAARRVSREVFEQIAWNADDASIRAGAAFHVARLAEGAGSVAAARQWARRCMALSPGHEASAALLHRLQLRKAS
jgi:hypothetical protein